MSLRLKWSIGQEEHQCNCETSEITVKLWTSFGFYRPFLRIFFITCSNWHKAQTHSINWPPQTVIALRDKVFVTFQDQFASCSQSFCHDIVIPGLDLACTTGLD
ncbi:hypothetical protein RRG08_027128 [Elysia crispata]|uniref:Uncharacterized protein n=1 Tax=Elysia crispata TaxID=231223 RepID=A0AAE0YWW8_9GAST|nr:hypothetical protein RRG08_027128 [Elysia crispata]